MEIELELTYLLKHFPENFKDSKFVEMIDLYIPQNQAHPHIRIRKRGNKMEITKKMPINGTDSSSHHEFTIPLEDFEYEALATLPSKKVAKLRYYYEVNGRTCEIDVFQEDLTGLVVVDFEFKTEEEMKNFQAPDFCAQDVTQDLLIAGGNLAGKSYSDIEKELKDKYNYLPLSI